MSKRWRVKVAIKGKPGPWTLSRREPLTTQSARAILSGRNLLPKRRYENKRDQS